MQLWGGSRGLVVRAVDYGVGGPRFESLRTPKYLFIHLFIYLATGLHAFMSYPYFCSTDQFFTLQKKWKMKARLESFQSHRGTGITKEDF